MKKISILILWCCALGGGCCLTGCKERPSAVESRKAEIRQQDSLALAQARVALAEADSLVTFRTFELDDLKTKFVLEKQEKYQTVGFYVLPAHAGSKERLTGFPEVEEGGQLLWVAIDRKRQYAFTELSLEAKERAAQLPAGLTAAQLAEVEQCAALAQAMADVQEVEKRREKLKVKVRFYEEKRDRRK